MSQAPSFERADLDHLLHQFDVTRPEDPDGAIDYCATIQSVIDTTPVDTSRPSEEIDRLQADVWFIRGMVLHSRGDLSEAIDLLEQAIERSAAIGYETRRILALRSIALCFENAGLQAESTRSIFEAIDAAAELDDPHIQALVSLTLTALYQAQGSSTLMHESALQTCAFAEQSDDLHLQSRALSSVGVSLSYVGRADESLTWLDRASALIADQTQPLEAVYLDLNRMFVLRRLDRIDEAVHLAARLVRFITRIPSADASRLGVVVSDIYLQAGDFEQAEHALELSVSAANSEQMTAHLLGYYQTAARLHEAKGDHHSALEMMKHFVRAERQIRGRNAEARVIALERRFAQQLAEKNNELSSLNHQKDEILDVVAHDLRNPLAAAEMLSESLLAESDRAMSHETADQLRSIRAATAEMRETISTLLHLEHQNAPSASASIGDVVLRSVAWAEEGALARDIDLRCEVTPISLEVDGPLLRRSLDDLLSSAIHASNNGGAVAVSCGPAGEGARIEVSYQSSAVLNDRKLYIARRLVERLRGSITFSQPELDGRAKAIIDLRR